MRKSVSVALSEEICAIKTSRSPSSYGTHPITKKDVRLGPDNSRSSEGSLDGSTTTDGEDDGADDGADDGEDDGEEDGDNSTERLSWIGENVGIRVDGMEVVLLSSFSPSEFDSASKTL
jgi:hypothetical protein